jgi:signal transduction histidine kinase
MGWVWWRFRKQPSVARPASHFAAGLLAATPAVFIYIDLALRGGDARPEYYAAGLDLRYLLIAIPLSIAFTILRYRAFRSTHPLLVLVFVIATSALLASLGTWLWGLAIDVNDRNAPPPFVPLFLVALVTGSLWSSQMQWRGALGRVFHWQERGFNELRAYADSLSGQADTAGLARRITTGLVDRFGCECAALWIWHPDVEALALTQAAGEWPDPLPQQAAFGLEQLRTVIQPRHLTGRVHDGFLDQLNANGCVVAAGLWDSLNDRPLGLLGIGKRKDDEVFDEHDLEILALSAHQAAAMLLAMRQIETLRGVPQRLLEAQQQERFRIAQDLHDTVQQRLGGVQPLLSAVRLYLQRDLSRADQLLSESAAGIETAAQMVSRIRHDLAPPELAGSLAQALSGALEQFRARTGIEASLTIDADLDHRLSPEARQALWMIVHQALDNVAEHAGAARVTVSLTGAADALTFEIRDTGRGFSPAGLQAARNAGSFGLTSMRARANALGGELVVTSVEGAGTCVSGRLPYARRDDGAGPTTMRIPDDGPTSRP